jgi:hypothetical protein
MGRSTYKETGLSEQRKYRSWTAQQKLEIVLAGLSRLAGVPQSCSPKFPSLWGAERAAES